MHFAATQVNLEAIRYFLENGTRCTGLFLDRLLASATTQADRLAIECTFNAARRLRPAQRAELRRRECDVPAGLLRR